MAFFSKKEQTPTTDTISTLIIHPVDHKEVDAFASDISGFKPTNKAIILNTKQQQINIAKAEQSIKTASKLNLKEYDIVILFHCDSIVDDLLPVIRGSSHLFIIIYSNNANESAVFREKVFKMSCNMVTKDIASIHNVYGIISVTKSNYINNKGNKLYECPHPKCDVRHLTEKDLWLHFPLYHIGEKNLVRIKCPVCQQMFGREDRPFQVHLRNEHGLCKTHECEAEYRKGVPSYIFSLVVVRRKSDDKFLLVQEFASTGFWLPGGRVDPGETTEAAAVRECEEEAGVKIKLKGILKVEYQAHRYENRRFQHTPERDYNRMRVIYYAEPEVEEEKESGPLLAKSVPDYESMGACWVQPDEIMKVHLRAYEPTKWIPYVANGGNIYPLEILECEQRNIVQ